MQNNLKQLSYALDKIVIGYTNTIQEATGVLLNFQAIIENDKKQLIFLEKTVDHYNPQKQLKRGYSITTDKYGKIVRSVKQVKKDDKINVIVSDGKIKSKVESK